MKFKKITLEPVSELPRDPKDPSYIIWRLVVNNMEFLKAKDKEAGIFAVDFQKLGDKSTAKIVTGKDKDGTEVTGKAMVQMPITPLFFGSTAITTLQETINGVMAAFMSDYFLVISEPTDEYLLIQMRMVDLEDMDKIMDLEDSAAHNMNTCEEIDCPLCDKLRDVSKDAFDVISEAHESFIEEFEEEAANTDKVDNMSDERKQEIANNLGADEIPLIDDEDEDELFD